MKTNHKGFTLIEIILSITILSILVMATYTVITNNLGFMRMSKDMSRNTLLSQQEIELDKNAIKESLRETGHGLDIESIVIDGITVDYHEVSKEYNGQRYTYRVTSEQPPEYLLLKTFDVDNYLISEDYKAFSAYPIAGSEVLGTSSPDPSTFSTHWMLDLNQWYVSKPGFNIPVPRGDILDTDFRYYDYLVAENREDEIGVRYPNFPDDYILLGTETSNNILDITKYAGRHLVYKVTAAAKSGRIGIPEVSDPIYVNGLNDTNGLEIHLDATMIDSSYRDSDNSYHVDSNSKVARWFDLSSGIGRSEPNEIAIQNDSDERPELVNSDVDIEFNGRFIDFDSGESLTINSQDTNNRWIYAFSVVRGDSGNRIFQNGSMISTIDTESIEIDGVWKIVYDNYYGSSNTFMIGDSDTDIAELIVYAFDSELSSEEESNLISTIEDYAGSKYLKVDMYGEVDEVLPMTETVYVGDYFNAPPSMYATMMSGLSRYVPIVWEGGNTIDTSTVGTVVKTGHVSYDEDKSATLTVNIIKRPVQEILLEPANLELGIDSDPYRLNATVYPGNATDKRIDWSTSNSSVAIVDDEGFVTSKGLGTAIITATSVDNPDVTANTTVSVLNLSNIIQPFDWPENMILQLDSSIGVSSSGTGVNEWLDRSGNGNHFTQSMNSRKPTINEQSNGLPVLSFDGSDSLVAGKAYLDVTDSSNETLFTDADNYFTVFIVGKSNNHNSQGTFFSKAGGWAGQATYVFGRNGSFIHVLRGNNKNSTNGDSIQHIHTMIWDGTNHLYWLDSDFKENHNEVGEASNQNNNNNHSVAIGASSGGDNQYLDGEIAEVIVFDHNLSLDDRNTVYNYLKNKWASVVEHAWHFNENTEGWDIANGVSGFGYSNGSIGGTIINNDPHIVSSDYLNKDITNAKKLMIRLKNSTNSDMAQIYFTTNSSTVFAENKRVNFEIVPNSEYTDYIIDMGVNSNWDGTLKRLRVDPSTSVSSGAFEIDFIRIIN